MVMNSHAGIEAGVEYETLTRLTGSAGQTACSVK